MKIFKQKFLDMEIVNTWNSDGWVLVYDGCSIANCSTLADAQRYAVLFYMIHRPEKFKHQMFQRALRQGSGCVHEWFALKKQLEIEGRKIPSEITCSDDGNCMILCNGEIV